MGKCENAIAHIPSLRPNKYIYNFYPNIEHKSHGENVTSTHAAERMRRAQYFHVMQCVNYLLSIDSRNATVFSPSLGSWQEKSVPCSSDCFFWPSCYARIRLYLINFIIFVLIIVNGRFHCGQLLGQGHSSKYASPMRPESSGSVSEKPFRCTLFPPQMPTSRM